jgi:hypothetical protein
MRLLLREVAGVGVRCSHRLFSLMINYFIRRTADGQTLNRFRLEES